MQAVIERGFVHAQGQPTIRIQPTDQTYDYAVIDLETASGRPENWQGWARAWKPSLRWKNETIGARFRERWDKAEEKSALLDSAPVVMVAIASDSELRCLHCLERREPIQVETGMVEGFASETEMLEVFRGLLEMRCSADTLLVGHNMLGFDLRRLRLAFVRSGLRLPECLADRSQPVYDTMREFCGRFSIEGQQMISLAEACERLAITTHKDLVDGSQVPELIEAGEIDALVQYSLLDALTERKLYLRMTGQGSDQTTNGEETA